MKILCLISAFLLCSFTLSPWLVACFALTRKHKETQEAQDQETQEQGRNSGQLVGFTTNLPHTFNHRFISWYSCAKPSIKSTQKFKVNSKVSCRLCSFFTSWYSCQLLTSVSIKSTLYSLQLIHWFIMSDNNSNMPLPPGWTKGYSKPQKKTYYCHPEVRYTKEVHCSTMRFMMIMANIHTVSSMSHGPSSRTISNFEIMVPPQGQKSTLVDFEIGALTS